MKLCHTEKALSLKCGLCVGGNKMIPEKDRAGPAQSREGQIMPGMRSANSVVLPPGAAHMSSTREPGSGDSTCRGVGKCG